ncbi:MAG: hypothetical protein JO123_01315, partial [Ktedonobacteraceae bacterium]|nr:hypothetical protein [Ktedonobacteraceae bacterium]
MELGPAGMQRPAEAKHSSPMPAAAELHVPDNVVAPEGQDENGHPKIEEGSIGHDKIGHDEIGHDEIEEGS